MHCLVKNLTNSAAAVLPVLTAEKKRELTRLHPDGSLCRSTEVAPCRLNSFCWQRRVKTLKAGKQTRGRNKLYEKEAFILVSMLF